MTRRNKRTRLDGDTGDDVRADYRSTAASPGLTMIEARELVDAEMRAAQSRIDKVFLRVDSPSATRPALLPATAPAQAQADSASTATQDCASCAALQAKINDLQKQAAVHREERRTWQDFKTWWLRNLAKHQRREQSSLSAPLDARTGQSRPRATRQDPISHMISDLDSDARRIWEQAGVMPAVEKLDESATDSEPVLNMVRPTLTTPARSPTKRVIQEAQPRLPAPHTSSSSSRKRAPLIRTTQPRTATVQPRPATSDVGFVDGAPERNRHARRSMIAHDCPDCAFFYSHFDNRVGGASTERQACSRHRTTYQRATTPQGYWNIGFPTTQDAEEINQLARQQHQQSRI